MFRTWLGLLCCLTLFAGCAREPERIEPKKANGEQATADQLQGRLDAAMSMTNLNQRDEALRAVAEDAASSGEAEVVKQALNNFTSLNLKDEAASAAALKLAKFGNPQAASEVAKMMTNLNMRDDVLEKIAKGQ